MATVEVKRRRGTGSQMATFVPAEGEIVVDTTNDRIVLGDGSTIGGLPHPNFNDVIEQAFTYDGTVGGTANDIVVNLATPILAYAEGMSIEFKANVANTGPMTIAIDGLTPKDIIQRVGNTTGPLQADALAPDIIYKVTYDGVAFQLSSGSSGGAGFSQQQFLTAGSYTWTKPAGCRFIRVRTIGGGGASRSSPSGSTTGGTTNFGAYCSATGGASGSGAGGLAAVANGGAGGSGSSGDINLDGERGDNGFINTNSYSAAAKGGRSSYNQIGAGADGSFAFNSSATGGGGAGGESIKIINVTAITSVNGTVGAGGVATGGGIDGNPGGVIVEEFY